MFRVTITFTGKTTWKRRATKKQRKDASMDRAFGIGPWAHLIFKNLSERMINATLDQNASVYFAFSISIQRSNKCVSMLDKENFSRVILFKLEVFGRLVNSVVGNSL